MICIVVEVEKIETLTLNINAWSLVTVTSCGRGLFITVYLPLGRNSLSELDHTEDRYSAMKPTFARHGDMPGRKFSISV